MESELTGEPGSSKREGKKDPDLDTPELQPSYMNISLYAAL